MQENDKNIQKICKNINFNTKIVQRSSEGPTNYPKFMHWQGDHICLDFRIQAVARESDLGWLFIEIGTPSAFGLQRDERESECWNSSVKS